MFIASTPGVILPNVIFFIFWFSVLILSVYYLFKNCVYNKMTLLNSDKRKNCSQLQRKGLAPRKSRSYQSFLNFFLIFAIMLSHFTICEFFLNVANMQVCQQVMEKFFVSEEKKFYKIGYCTYLYFLCDFPHLAVFIIFISFSAIKWLIFYHLVSRLSRDLNPRPQRSALNQGLPNLSVYSLVSFWTFNWKFVVLAIETIKQYF